VTERPESEPEVAAIFTRLRQEVATMMVEERGVPGAVPADAQSTWRTEAQRLAGVTAERPYLFKPGRWGRLRGYLLLPIKVVLRRQMRWYVEPLATDQREFNTAVLRLVDEVDEHAILRSAELEESLSQLEQRIARLEGNSVDEPFS
jgi:hypothetical protein